MTLTPKEIKKYSSRELVSWKKLQTKKYQKNFQQLGFEERTIFLTELDIEQDEYHKNKKSEDPNHYFRMIKQLTMLGYFTSQLGATTALRYNPIPGRYDGDIPYKKGDRAWA